MPRKTARGHHREPPARAASMRPRPDATENGQEAQEGAEAGAASMRPRPDATENGRHLAGPLHPPPASMRPRPDATENRKDPVEAQMEAAGLQ